ncbi:MAG: hypothetical protein IT233_08455 [Bacteroidia bacterium]|nr:hypothetical protein [Bacteroidia bacterium]
METKRGAAAGLCCRLLGEDRIEGKGFLSPESKTARTQPHVIRNKAWHLLLELIGEERGRRRDLISEAQLLQELGLIREALKSLEKAINSFMLREEYAQGLVGLARMIELKQRAGMQLRAGDLKRHQDREKICMEALQEHLYVRQDSARVFFLMRSTGESGRMQQLKLLRRILRAPFYSSERNIRTFKGGVGFFQLHGAYETINGKHQKAIHWHSRLLKFLEKHPDRIREQPLLLLSVANNMANVFASMKEPGAIVSLITRLRSAPSRFAFENTRTWKRDIFVTMYPALHGVYIDSRMYDHATSIIRDTEIQLRNLERDLGPAATHIFHYNLAVLYFGQKKYPETILNLNKLLQSAEAVRPDLLLSARIIQLLLFYERNDVDALEYGWINLKRILGKRTMDNSVLYIVFNALVKTPATHRSIREKVRKHKGGSEGIVFNIRNWLAHNGK